MVVASNVIVYFVYFVYLKASVEEFTLWNASYYSIRFCGSI